MESVLYGGWNCAHLTAGEAEILVTLDVGPRIIRYAFPEGENELFESAKDAGKKGGTEYRSYGGHRLWVGPEHAEKTLQPENEPVEYTLEGDTHVFRSQPDKFGLQKEIRIKTAGEAVKLEHRIYNRAEEPNEFAPWALTVMAAGGECLFPQAPHQPHSENFLPVRPLVLWSYTDMSDPRWTWGRHVIRLRQDPDRGPQKVGMLIPEGYAAYANHGNLFLKRFEYIQGATYTDMGCNFETFTREDMLEVESLGPFQSVVPGSYASHRETWYLLRDAIPPQGDEECGEWLQELTSIRPL
jgi:hypothetical protein